MTPHEIKALIEFALDIHECKEIKDKALLAFLVELDPEERVFHIEYPGEYNKTLLPILWSIRAWRECSEKWFKDRVLAAEERRISAEREKALRKLTAAIIKESGLDIEQAAILAHRMLCKNRIGAKLIFNVDLTAVPEAPDDSYLINRLL